MEDFMKRGILAALSVAVTMAFSSSFAGDNSALKQLQDANTGTQSTSKTFDNSSRPQPSDAYPKASPSVPSVQGQAVDKSTSSASGFSVDTSSTTPRTTRKGSETTK
jgi:hypothetical protein